MAEQSGRDLYEVRIQQMLRYYDASARFLNRYPTDTPRAPVAPACEARKVYILLVDLKVQAVPLPVAK